MLFRSVSQSRYVSHGLFKMRHAKAFYTKDAVDPANHGDAYLYVELGAILDALDKSNYRRDDCAHEFVFKCMREIPRASAVTRRDFKEGWDQVIAFIKGSL